MAFSTLKGFCGGRGNVFSSGGHDHDQCKKATGGGNVGSSAHSGRDGIGTQGGNACRKLRRAAPGLQLRQSLSAQVRPRVTGA